MLINRKPVDLDAVDPTARLQSSSSGPADQVLQESQWQ